MASRLSNLKAVFSNVKIRTIMILTVAIMLLVIVVGVIGIRHANQSAAQAQLTKASNLQSVPGLQATSAQYAQIQQTVNQQNYQQASTTSGTAIPTIINQQDLNANNNPDAYNLNNNNTNNGANGMGNGTNGESSSGGTSSSKSTSTGPTAEQMKELEAQQKAQMDAMQTKLDQLSSQQQQQQMQQTQGDMQKEAQQVLTALNGASNNPVQHYVAGDLVTQAGKSGTSTSGLETGSDTSTNQTIGGANGALYKSDVMIKAGTILFGVLTTAVNSDEPGPVMATIVDGQYKGAKLIGSIQNSRPIVGSNGATKLVLNFTTMSVPYLPESISVSAVAIDPDTARTALASDVDHHYMERYGSLFASSFLEGWGQEISSAGDTVTVSPFGGTTTTKGNSGTTQTVVVNPDGTTTTTTTTPASNASSGTFGVGENVAAGLGQVGTNWGQQLGDTFNRPNTVMINSGVSIGLLFLDDVSTSGGNTPVSTSTTTSQSLTTGTSTVMATPSTTTNSVAVVSSSTPVPLPTQ